MDELFDPTTHSDRDRDDSRPRRRRVIAGAAVGGLALGAVGLVQLATASDGDPVAVRTAAAASTSGADDTAATDGIPSADGASVVDDGSDADGPFAGWSEFDEAFGAYDDCLQDRVGNLLPDWDSLGEEFGEWADGLEIDVPWHDGSVLVETGEGLPTWFDFGEGDGSVTVTRSAGSISVETSGDVTEVDGSEFLDDVLDSDVLDGLPALPEFDSETLAELESAHQACADLLPDDLPFDLEGLDLGEFDLGEIDPGAFDLDGFDLGEIDLGSLDLDAELDELRNRLGDLGIDLEQFGIDPDELDAMLDQLTSTGD